MIFYESRYRNSLAILIENLQLRRPTRLPSLRLRTNDQSKARSTHNTVYSSKSAASSQASSSSSISARTSWWAAETFVSSETAEGSVAT